MEGGGGRRECRAERGQSGPGEAGQLQLVYYKTNGDFLCQKQRLERDPLSSSAPLLPFVRPIGREPIPPFSPPPPLSRPKRGQAVVTSFGRPPPSPRHVRRRRRRRKRPGRGKEKLEKEARFAAACAHMKKSREKTLFAMISSVLLGWCNRSAKKSAIFLFCILPCQRSKGGGIFFRLCLSPWLLSKS